MNPHPIAWDFLTPDQRLDLHESLRDLVPDDTAREAAILAIDMACGQAKLELQHPAVIAKHMAVERQHMRAVVKAVDQLRTALEHQWPRWGLAGLDRDRLLRDLAAVRAAATTDAGPETRPAPGRPPLVWRDRLIAVVYSIYPEGTALKSQGSHFERLVELLLEWLGAEIDDVHSVIIDAMRRCPDPPFRVTVPRKR